MEQEATDKKAPAGHEEAAIRDRVRRYCEIQRRRNKILPVWERAGIEEFIVQLALAGQKPVAFGERKQDKTLEDWFVDFLEGMPRSA